MKFHGSHIPVTTGGLNCELHPYNTVPNPLDKKRLEAIRNYGIVEDLKMTISYKINRNSNRDRCYFNKTQ